MFIRFLFVCSSHTRTVLGYDTSASCRQSFLDLTIRKSFLNLTIRVIDKILVVIVRLANGKVDGQS
jgi:hypothetical protein